MSTTFTYDRCFVCGRALARFKDARANELLICDDCVVAVITPPEPHEEEAG